ncbi:putative NADPH-quinone reductase [Allocatelliglobosispora scoriae]|uniref:Putative NADPH-quinone reductase n=1 Tax=Allocatelliglobosispora scoriae TaxID=643052 RepID=A0A841BN49_9ACTN|nr:NAD(P)H-dependent oxidoreductase [Allocatelliglobosispora scoriae]MBB5868808.1 putative NADPH-quinone reductase [Allocatelliglobosispora scoriae]
MKVKVVLSHPYDGSYCYALTQSVLAGLARGNHEVDFLHLEEDGFNPVMSAEDLRGYATGTAIDPKVHDYQQRTRDADYLVFIFPIWWELMPAVLKGYFDKVYLKGFAYEEGRGGRFTTPLTRTKGVTIITTMTMPGFLYRIWFGNAIQRAMIRGTFHKIGMHRKTLTWINFDNVKSVSQDRRVGWLSGIENRFAGLDEIVARTSR